VASTIKVRLGETDYDVPKMTIGQIEAISELDGAPSKWSFAAIAILMRRAKPEINDIREIECEPEQMRTAIEQIMRHSGYRLPDPNAKAPGHSPGKSKAAS
jgi:hypothetical protein